MEILYVLGGMALGGSVAFVLLCCLQLHRINEYESEIRRLRAKSDEK